MNIFERASRAKLRFATAIGELTAEQLWDLPLAVRGDRPDLDKIARAVHFELKGLDEVSFVDTKPDPRKVDLELRFDILKHIIDSKKTDAAAAQTAAQNAEFKRKLLDALAAKEGEELSKLSADDLKKKLAELA